MILKVQANLISEKNTLESHLTENLLPGNTG